MPEKTELTEKQKLEIKRHVFKRCSEFILEEFDQDIQNFADMDILDQVYTNAYWTKTIDYIFEKPNRIKKIDTKEDLDQVMMLIFEVHPELQTTENLEKNIEHRFEWLKKKIAQQYELGVKKLININNVMSPIEHIFIMEWEFIGLEKRFKIELIPQKRVETDIGTYYLDFLILPKDKRIPKFKIAIELDGHDFHEKTKEQVAKDKKRERQIISKGYTVLRFTGSEIYNNPRACINEISDYIENIIFSKK